MNRTGHITILKDIYRDGCQFTKDELLPVTLHYMGIVGGFDRYPQDNTMEGNLDLICVVELPTGRVLKFELQYEISLELDPIS